MPKKFPGIFFLLLFVLCISLSTFAEMGELVHVINEDSGQCGSFFMGVECTECELPPGWTILEEPLEECIPISEAEFSFESYCIPLKTEFCCTLGRSGMPGNCHDLVLNEAEQKCAFVENIGECKNLPQGWQQAKESSAVDGLCPVEEYKWLGAFLECEKKPKDVKQAPENGQQKLLPSLPQGSLDPTKIAIVGLVIAAALALLGYKRFKNRLKT